jgi:hypothetical protein
MVVIFLFAHFTRLFEVHHIVPSFGRVSGVLRPPGGSHSFLRTAAWGKILTGENLFKRGYSLVGWCCMCRCDGETIDHLLLHCDVAYTLCCVVFRAFGINWVLSRRVTDLLFGWRNWFENHS